MFVNDNGYAFRGQLTKDPKNPRQATLKNYCYLRYGLGEGTSDIVGWLKRKITIEDVGKFFAQFVAVEIKVGKDKTSDIQKNFIAAVRRDGGIAGVCYELEEIDKLLNN